MVAVTTSINRKKSSTVEEIRSTKFDYFHADVVLQKLDQWCISGGKSKESFQPHQNLKRSGAEREQGKDCMVFISELSAKNFDVESNLDSLLAIIPNIQPVCMGTN